MPRDLDAKRRGRARDPAKRKRFADKIMRQFMQLERDHGAV